MEASALFPARLSLQVACLSTILIVATGIPIAYLLARKEFKGREMLDMVFTLPLVLPPTVTGYYLILIFGRNGLFWAALSINGPGGASFSPGMRLCCPSMWCPCPS